MYIIARGKIVKDGSGGFALQVAPNQSFTLLPNDWEKQLEPLAGTATTVTAGGQLYKKPPGKRKPAPAHDLKLEVLEVRRKE